MSIYWSQFLLLSLAHLAAVISPGPDFLITLKQSIQRGLKPALWTAVGIGCGIVVHICYVIFGVAVLLKQYPVFFLTVRIGGAIYLLWLAWQCLHSSAIQSNALENMHPDSSPQKPFWLGFWTNVLNPKATLFFLSLYTAVVSLETPAIVQWLYGIWMALTTALWFMLVAFIMVQAPIRQRFLRYGVWVDRVLAVLLFTVAVRLLWTVAQ